MSSFFANMDRCDSESTTIRRAFTAFIGSSRSDSGSPSPMSRSGDVKTIRNSSSASSFLSSQPKFLASL